jgi:DNA repair exonuclease SbcCD ATPase subunit
MPSDTVHDGNGIAGLEARILRVQESRTRLTTLRDQLANDLASKEVEIVRLTNELDILTKVTELFRHLMDQLIDKQVKVVERVATEGLQTVFPDLNLSLEAEVEPKYNKISVDFFFRRGLKGHRGSHRGHPLSSFGGGPASVVSLILRVLTVKKLNLAPCLILDESLGAVSEEYIDATGQFIRALAEKLGFDILLVTHKPSFLAHSKHSYRCQEDLEDDGVSTHLSLKRIS